MATLTPTITLASSDATSDTLALSVTDTLTITEPSVGLSKITVTTTASDSIIVPSLDARRYLFAHNTGVDSSGSDTTSEVYIESELGRIGKLDVDEFLFMPLDSNGVNKIQLKATSGTVVVEYAYWTKG